MEDTPRFTVHQIMLLQKLKQSGLSRAQILKGLDEIEKVDEIPSTGTPVSNSRPSISPPPTNNGPGTVLLRDEMTIRDHHRQSNSPISPQPTCSTPSNIPLNRSPKMIGTHPMLPMHQGNPLIFNSHLQNPNQISLLHPGGAWSTGTSRAVAAATAASILHNGYPHHSIPHSIYPSLMNGRSAPPGMANVYGVSNGNAVVEIDGEKIDITDELNDLFRRDQAQVKEDIRKFINERHISQSAIAKATGNAISQSYISQWLAQPQDISGQKKKAMYTWYLIEKRKPPGVVGMNTSVPIVFRSETEMEYAPPICSKTKRGARFTWPKECLTILENYYNANPYPDESKREEIASACNVIIQTHKAGMMMTDLDKVTTVKVYNWFANRRKDDKRRKHIEHIEALDQHVLTSPTHRSNTVSPSSSNHSNDSMQQPEMPEHHILSDRIHPEILAMRKKEEQMALALQMAAVNHSILALVNQHRDMITDQPRVRASPGGESEREENDDDSVGAGSQHEQESRGQELHQRYRSEDDSAEDHQPSNTTAMEIHRESGNPTMTQSTIQART